MRSHSFPIGNSLSAIRRRRSKQHRTGAAITEFAVCLPILVLLVFGSIEASSYIFLKQSLGVAAYEGTRQAIRNTSTNADTIARIDSILNSRGVVNYAVSFPAGDVADLERGEEVIVQVSAPTQANSPLAGEFLANATLTSRVVMVKE